MTSLLPDTETHPYYIFSARYTRTSAGIRALHLLCHWLNKSGMRAHVAFFGRELGVHTHPDLLTPMLTQEVIDFHHSQGKTPIIIYPEVISGNPANADCVVRYVLNIPGLLGGDTTFPESDLVYGFSKRLAECCGRPESILHVPVLDTTTFTATPEEERTEVCFYAQKYQLVHKQKVFGLPEGAIEITRDRPDSHLPPEIADLFRRSKVFYCFENTALASEAVLCGCPAVFMPNDHLDWPIALDELGWDGFAWGDSPEELDRAVRTVGQGRDNYQKTIDLFFTQLKSFIAATQEQAAALEYKNKITLDDFDIHAGEVIGLAGSKLRWSKEDALDVITSIDAVEVADIVERLQYRNRLSLGKKLNIISVLDASAADILNRLRSIDRLTEEDSLSALRALNASASDIISILRDQGRISQKEVLNIVSSYSARATDLVAHLRKQKLVTVEDELDLVADCGLNPSDVFDRLQVNGRVTMIDRLRLLFRVTGLKALFRKLKPSKIR
ncbi:MAG: hypothetical protein ACPGOY_15380 [Rhodospirillaceae bacterium]